ncbi:hypothetical protein CHS0354_029602 [Potamilus streckersoni]|uniref:Phorbol-ester/DAG-type domain-containing protein n=1 Tax=Potamilus streckersoni TaxID=2493646 RepID=A0AAE0VJS1_9BIVA|nr:hypothetical protein CHS0354_029602 [Potamilus streckersoni]
MEHAASSIRSSASCPDSLSSANKNYPVDVFDAFKQGLIKNVMQGFGLLSFRQKNSSKEEESPLTDNVSHPEHIEMCHFQRREPAKGHNFQPLQLLNPTWCDECAEFIWGVYKQCLRCKNNTDSEAEK